MRRPQRPLSAPRGTTTAISSASAAALGTVSGEPPLTARLSVAVLLWLALASAASAQAPARDAYFGAGVGRLAYEIRSNGEAFFDTTSSLVKFYGGFRLARDWGFEASYEVTDTAQRDGLPTGIGVIALPAPYLVDPTTTVRVEIATLRAIRYASYDWGSLFAGFGASGASIDSEFRVGAGLPAAGMLHSSSNGLTLTAGAQWNFASLSLRLEYEWWHADMRGISVSAHWRD